MLQTVGIPYKLFKTIPAKATILMSSPSLTSCLIIRTCSWVSWSLSVPDLHVRSIKNCSCKFATGQSLKRGGDGDGNSCFKFKSPYTVSILSLFFEVSVVNQKYSRLSLNGHLYKTDTSLNGHLELVPAFLYSLYLTLYKTDISLRRTLTAGPKGVPLRGS